MMIWLVKNTNFNNQECPMEKIRDNHFILKNQVNDKTWMQN